MCLPKKKQPLTSNVLIRGKLFLFYALYFLNYCIVLKLGYILVVSGTRVCCLCIL
jgi:hypothetical protein